MFHTTATNGLLDQISQFGRPLNRSGVDNCLRNSPRPPQVLLAVTSNQPRQLINRIRIDDIRRCDFRPIIHPHIQRSVKPKRKTSLCSVKLWRRHPQISQNHVKCTSLLDQILRRTHKILMNQRHAFFGQITQCVNRVFITINQH